jgi:hypothetical protein
MQNQQNIQAAVQNVINNGGNISQGLSQILQILDMQIAGLQQLYHQNSTSIASISVFSNQHQLRLSIQVLMILRDSITRLQANLLVGSEETEIKLTHS